jgi:hypothetical protein
MKIQLTPQESEQHFHNALCNGVGVIEGYGLAIRYNKSDYQTAKANLQTLNPDHQEVCYEDILMEILKGGGKLILIDEEGDEEQVSITLPDVHERVSQTPIPHLLNAVTENDDAETADVILQTVFLNEVVYG